MKSLAGSNASSLDLQQLLTGVKQQAAQLDQCASIISNLKPGEAPSDMQSSACQAYQLQSLLLISLQASTHLSHLHLHTCMKADRPSQQLHSMQKALNWIHTPLLCILHLATFGSCQRLPDDWI